MKNQPFLVRLSNAWRGIVISWRSEMSFRIHVAATALVVALLATMHPAPVWWAVLLVTCGLVLGLELVNTGIEKLVDLLHPEQHPMLRVVKDTLAGAVLLACIIAVLVFIAFICAESGL